MRKTLQVVADLETVRVMNGLTQVACHRRSWDKGAQIENQKHIEELKERKKEAKKHRGMNRLRLASPTTAKILQLAVQRGQNLGALASGLLNLLDLYGAVELEHGVFEAIDARACRSP